MEKREWEVCSRKNIKCDEMVFKRKKPVPEEVRQKIANTLTNKDPENLSELFTETHKQILFGSVLGDASLSQGRVNCLFEETHSIKQKDYLIWKSYWFRILGSKIRNRIYKNRKVNKSYKSVTLSTSAIPLLKKYHRIFYPNGKKVIPPDILNQLNELGLVVWYLDDGSVTKPGNLITFSTDAYSYNNHLLILNWFKRKFGILPKISKRRGNYYLTFNSKDSHTLLSIFKNVFESYDIPKSMWYKLGGLWEGNIEKIRVAMERKNKYKRNWRRKRSSIKLQERLLKLRKIVKDIEDLYWKKGLPASKVGERLGISKSYVYKIMKKFNISRRTRSEANSGERNGFFGKHHSRESIEKMLKKRWGSKYENSFLKSTV